MANKENDVFNDDGFISSDITSRVSNSDADRADGMLDEATSAKDGDGFIMIKCHKSFRALPNFAEIDEEYRATFKARKVEAARRHGYKYLSAAIYDMYYNRRGTFKVVSRMLTYEGYSVGQFIRKLEWPTRHSGGLQSSSLSLAQVAEIRTRFGQETGFKKEKFMTFYRKKANEHRVSIETIRRIIYNTTFFDENYSRVAEQIKKTIRVGSVVQNSRIKFR